MYGQDEGMGPRRRRPIGRGGRGPRPEGRGPQSILSPGGPSGGQGIPQGGGGMNLQSMSKEDKISKLEAFIASLQQKLVTLKSS